MNALRAEDERWPEDGLEHLGRCPVCGSTRRGVLYRDLVGRSPRPLGRWTIYRCAGCTVGYLDPRPTVETIELAYRGYQTHRPPVAPRSSLRRRLRHGYLNARFGYRFSPAVRLGAWTVSLLPVLRWRAARMVRWLPCRPGARLLDVGSGSGAFLRAMHDQGWEVNGLEPDPRAASAPPGVAVACEVLRPGVLPSGGFDAITLHHSLEHMHDPVEALAVCRDLLAPGGSIYIATPNLDSAAHRHFGRAWSWLGPPRHLVLFTARALGETVRRAGLRQVRVLPAAGAAGSTAASRALQQAPPRLAWPAELAIFAGC
jgi:SAM-dependent methyltransferase